ncbi:MAG: hypothetical protein EOO73_35470 [Myxococcales bacterium]|nr:MAG: hypothetical protein EOO73_35470 [Myxococcales bacterium]
MAEAGGRRARVERLLAAARELPGDASLARRLVDTTGLSPANVEIGLQRCLETHVSPEDLASLLESTPESSTAHVLLSANVFVAALRAIAIGVASSPRVMVRPSRRDPALAEALHALAPELFALVPRLEPARGEHLWSYGSDGTMAELRASLPEGVWLHAHGAGFGAVVLSPASLTRDTARAVALDTALFDQRGCASPRVVCVVGGVERAQSVAKALAEALRELEVELPPGERGAVELAELRRSRDAAAYAFELFDAGRGWVSVSDRVVIPPAERSLHVVACPDPSSALRPFAAHLTCVACNDASFQGALRQAFPGARVVAPGDMQRPVLDGPVDRRHGTRGELIRCS